MFGDKKAYLDKFMTCARTRPISEQKLTSKFFEREHTKPIFARQSLMTLHNLYAYHCCNELFKVFKYRTPIALFELFCLSKRPGKETLLITTMPSNSFVYKSSCLWNSFRQMLALNDLEITHGVFKSKVKKVILSSQGKGDKNTWAPLANFLNSGSLNN